MLTRRRILRAATLVGAAIAGGVGIGVTRRANAYYSGPVSDHFDGLRFFNPGGRSPKGLQHLASLYFGESWARWPARYDSPFSDTPPPIIGDRAIRVGFVGHASWLVQTCELNILIDPVWSDRASPIRFGGPSRVNAPGIRFEDLPRIDVVLITHNHYDHLDVETLKRLWLTYRPRMVSPLGNDVIMRDSIGDIRVETMDWGGSLALSPSVRVHAEPSLHWSARGLSDRRHALWASFVLETRAGAVYAIGDTGFGDGETFRAIAKRHPKIDLALLPIGAYEPRWFMRDQHMNPADAVEAFVLCGARRALGHHWGTFQLTTEPHEQPADDLKIALQARGISPDRFLAVRPGQVELVVI